MKNYLIFFLLLLSFPGLAQKLKKQEKAIVDNLTAHISYLSDDRLEGRRAGTNGEKMAMEYISSQFKKAGLAPKGDSGTFFQAFGIDDGRSYHEKSHLYFNNEKISTSDFFPYPFSPQLQVEATPSIALQEAGVPWFLDMKEAMQAAKNNPHFNTTDYLSGKAKEAAKKGATALFVFNSDPETESLKYNAKEKTETSVIPVIIVANNLAKKYFSDETASIAIRLNIEFTENKRTAHNVIGYIDNGAATTVVIGAHFDHLGFGEDGNSLQRAGERLIHNGADDNASGTSALIELAKLLKASKLKNNNYLFIAFSGEELGLFGSKYFVEHPTIDLSGTNYMINLDMVGRLNETSKLLTIGGYGTSPLWPQVFTRLNPSPFLVNKYDSSGTGPSDHTSFYRKSIPVLFFFTGLHSDYHKPTDDLDKVNAAGEYRILQFIYKVIAETNKTGKLTFTPTREQQSGTSARFTVSLGIMPDYTFSGTGVRVDGISDGRPAQKAGLQAGDVVIQLGEHQVSSLEGYMQALNKFKKGDNTKVKVKRAEETLEVNITF